MTHYLKMNNIAASVEEVKAITASCKICAECKPCFFKPMDSNLMKATQPFERLSIDFKGAFPNVTQNRFILL